MNNKLMTEIEKKHGENATQIVLGRYRPRLYVPMQSLNPGSGLALRKEDFFNG
jgi:hypothetical protein